MALVIMKRNVLIIVSALTLLASFAITGSFGLFLPNLDDSCMRCLCYLPTKCNMNYGCVEGNCGPFNISYSYWLEGGRATLPDDDPERNRAYEDCAQNYHCAVTVVKNYMQKYGRDCNGDGVTNCADYLLINGNGGARCDAYVRAAISGERTPQLSAGCNLVL